MLPLRDSGLRESTIESPLKVRHHPVYALKSGCCLRSRFGANDCASERHTPAGCSARGEASNGLGACARCRCRACDAREVYARMLVMCSAHPEIPCLPMLPQVSEMKLSVLNRVNLRVEGSLACLLHELSAWGACGRCGAAGKAVARCASHGLHTAVAAGGPRAAAQAGWAATHAAC